MSTRGVIARVGEHEGKFKGVYNHSDSYPTYMGPHLWKLLHGKYRGDVGRMLVSLIDRHSAGWSFVGEECYCHPKRKREAEVEANWFTHENTDRDIEWLWVFDEENRRLYIRDHSHGTDAAMVELDGDEPDWGVIQCGEELERCSHYAYVHFPELGSASELGTATYLGRREFELHDAIAFVIGGKRYANTRSGGHSDYFNNSPLCMRGKGKRWPGKTWIQSVKAGNGVRMEVPVAYITKDGYRPYKGVSWVFPPIKDNPSETLVTE